MSSNLYTKAKSLITPTYIMRIFPDGIQSGDEWQTRAPYDPNDERPGTRFQINIGDKLGQWIDHAHHDGGDFIRLIEKWQGLSGWESVCEWIIRDNGLDPEEIVPEKQKSKWKHPAAVIPIPPSARARLSGHTKKHGIKKGFTLPNSKKMTAAHGEPTGDEWEYHILDAAGDSAGVAFITYRSDKHKASGVYWGADDQPHIGLPPEMVRNRRGEVKKKRPLFNGQFIKNAKKILIVEGEKCASLKITDFGYTLITWVGGSNGAEYSDWDPLKKSPAPIYILPDNDDAGFLAAKYIAEELEHSIILQPPDDKARGWDLADYVADATEQTPPPAQFLRTLKTLDPKKIIDPKEKSKAQREKKHQEIADELIEKAGENSPFPNTNKDDRAHDIYYNAQPGNASALIAEHLESSNALFYDRDNDRWMIRREKTAYYEELGAENDMLPILKELLIHIISERCDEELAWRLDNLNDREKFPDSLKKKIGKIVAETEDERAVQIDALIQEQRAEIKKVVGKVRDKIIFYAGSHQFRKSIEVEIQAFQYLGEKGIEYNPVRGAVPFLDAIAYPNASKNSIDYRTPEKGHCFIYPIPLTKKQIVEAPEKLSEAGSAWAMIRIIQEITGEIKRGDDEEIIPYDPLKLPEVTPAGQIIMALAGGIHKAIQKQFLSLASPWPNSGKTMLTKAIKKIVGAKELITTLPNKAMKRDRGGNQNWSIKEFDGKAFVHSEETTELLDSNEIKEITGGGEVTAHVKHKDFTKVIFQGLYIITGQSHPQINAADKAMISRYMPINALGAYYATESDKTRQLAAGARKEHLIKADSLRSESDIMREIEAAAPAIHKYLDKAFIKLQKEFGGRIPHSPASQQTLAQITERDTPPFNTFITENYIVDDEGSIGKSAMRTHYKDATGDSYATQHPRSFDKQVKEIFGAAVSSCRMAEDHGVREQGWRGIRKRTHLDDVQEKKAEPDPPPPAAPPPSKPKEQEFEIY